MAVIKHKGKTYYLGTFDTEIEAARARDRKAYELEGEFAYLNLPDEIQRQTTNGSNDTAADDGLATVSRGRCPPRCSRFAPRRRAGRNRRRA